ncbi:MAG: glycosyltransferase family 4 protein [Candidatus Bathyarchaeia archaeon]|jgi:glycosyltransferase involved in cell wall biosynthesis
MAYAEKMLPERKGAIAPYVYGLSRELATGNDVDIVALGANEEYTSRLHVQTFEYNRYLFNLLRIIANDGVAHHLLSNAHFLKATLNIHRRYPIDILHVHDLYASIVAITCKQILNIPTVISLHNSVRTTWPLRAFDRVLTVSEYLKNDIAAKGGVKSSKIQILTPAVDTKSFEPVLTSDQAKNRLGLQRHRIVLFTGRKCPDKGPQVLIESLQPLIQEFPNLTAVLVGPDYSFGSDLNTYTGYLKSKAKRLNVDNHVIFEGYVPDGLLKLYYDAADVFVFPSVWQEPFGLSLVEALAFEKPAVATNVGGVPEIIEDGYNGLLVPPNDPAELTNGVRRLLLDKNLAAYLGKNGRETVRQNFSYEVVARRCLQIYKGIGDSARMVRAN